MKNNNYSNDDNCDDVKDEPEEKEEEKHDLPNQSTRNYATKLTISWLVCCTDREFILSIIPTPGMYYYYTFLSIITHYQTLLQNIRYRRKSHLLCTYFGEFNRKTIYALYR